MIFKKYIFKKKRIILAIDLAVWFFRLLHVTIYLKTVGPKLLMIFQMVKIFFFKLIFFIKFISFIQIKDLTFFMIIILIFVVSFGVVTQVIIRFSLLIQFLI